MPGISLEQLIVNNSHSRKQDISTFDFSNSKIVKIGIIPQWVSSQVQILNLANNNLRSIDGIEQFSRLESLNLKNNKISRGQSLLILKNLFHLKRLFLKGNSFLENPLNEQILSLLSSFQNDLQILDYAFTDPDRQALVREHRKSKSQSRILSISQIKKAGSQQQLQNLSSKIQVSKLIQKSKVSMLMGKMQEFIQQKHESQEISSYSIDNVDPISSYPLSPNHQLSLMKTNTQSLTPAKKSPRFPSFSVEQKSFNSMNQSKKFQEESTNLKQKYFASSRREDQENPFFSNSQSKVAPNNQFRWDKSIQNQNFNRSKESPERKFKYQVNNMNINLDLDNAPLNYPSITEKEDQDSYEIQFDFMSPNKISLSNKKIVSSRDSPSNQLKQITASYLKIQQDHISEQQSKQETKKNEESRVPSSPISVSSRHQISSATLSMLTKSKALRIQKESVQKESDKENYYQRLQFKQEPIIMARKGSLYQSARSLVPQTNTSTAQDIIKKLLNRSSQEIQSFSVNFSLSEMLENGQKFQKFYYTSLTRLKPAFNLLYSPFTSLKTEQKDLLLQELFKNHKQIFILLIKEFHSKEKLSEQLHAKSLEAQKGLQWASQNQALNQKLNQYEGVLDFQYSRYEKILMQNQKLQKNVHQFQDILASRQKIINDVKNQYEKVNKNLLKKQQLVQKFLNEDQIEEQIIQKNQRIVKYNFLKLFNKNAQWTFKLRLFIQNKKNRQLISLQRRNNQLKSIIFQSFKKNLNKQKAINQLLRRNQWCDVNSYFKQWKIKTHLQKLSNEIQLKISSLKRKQTLMVFHRFYLNNKRDMKIRDIARLKLIKTTFQKCFKQNHQMFQQRMIELQSKATNFQKMSLKKKYFYFLIITTKYIKTQSIKIQNKIRKEVIQKRQFTLFKNIIKFRNKDEEDKCIQIQQKVIRSNEIHLFLRKLKAYSQHRANFSIKLQASIEFRLKRAFNALKKITVKRFKKYMQFQNITRKISHQNRLRNLVTQFRQNDLKSKIESKKRELFFSYFTSFHKTKQTILKKKSDLINHLKFRKGLKAKNQLISYLRLFSIMRKLNNKQLSLQHHYLLQQNKYKQSHELNILTMQQLKEEIIACLGQIEFYKIQVQKLSQRELIILQEKQSYLIDIQCKHEQNLNLTQAILQNQRKLNELEKKYEKSLDMYADAIKQLSPRQKLIQNRTFFYDPLTLPGIGSPATFRRQTTQQNFTSLKR